MKTLGWVCLAAAGVVGCGEGDSTHTLDPSELSTGDDAEPTFWQDVAPILNEKCTACHQTGGIAPFALDNYADAERRATLIADMTESRIMPPYLMQVGGTCGSFDESAALTDAQIATIKGWADGDHAEGTPEEMTPRPLPSLTSGTDLYTPLFTPTIEGGVLAEFDEYRCFELDLGLDREAFVTGFEFTPGNAAMVHHVIAMLVDPGAPSAIDGQSNAQVMAALHAEDPGREGWHCFGEAGAGVKVESSPGGWAPGSAPFTYPEGVGVRVQPDRKLVVQVHYNLARPEVRGGSDQTRIRLQFADSVERQAGLLLQDAFLRTLQNDRPDVLEPGNPAARYTWTLTGAELGLPPGVPVSVLSVTPHMHQRGRKFTIEIAEQADFDCQGHIDRWDFNWQRNYAYRAPLTIDSTSQLRVTCEYDTSSDTAPVLPGWGTRNEMCELTMAVAFPPGLVF
jgi:copper type II ascorbate-dependent monooxygenase-like protein